MNSFAISMVGLCLAASCGQPPDAPSANSVQNYSPESCASEHFSVQIPSGPTVVGSESGYPDEAPIRRVQVGEFKIDRFEVTNRRFAEFVLDTGYITVAERVPSSLDHTGIPLDLLVPGSAVFEMPSQSNPFGGWVFVKGASWKAPEGPRSDIAQRLDHPVVHVAYADALAFAAWAGGDLPTEAEWEHAARGGLVSSRYEWGDEHPDAGHPKANTWQGFFPIENTMRDGFSGTAPTGCYEPNGYGLHDMTGNVWEWTRTKAGNDHPETGIIKGGSYLCAQNFCKRFRPAARHAQEKDFSASHIGFRVVYRYKH